MKRLLTPLLAGLILSGSASAQTMPETPSVIDSFAQTQFNMASGNYHEVIAPGPEATQFKFKLKGYVLGLRMIRADYYGYTDNGRYALYSNARTSGLAAFLKQMRIWGVTQGRYDASGMRPDFQVQQNVNKKNRRIEMEYDNVAKRVNVIANPRIGSQGVPPASEDERYAADDVLSVILKLLMTGQAIDGEPCTGKAPVFDNKQHYNLRMENTGIIRFKKDGFKGDVLTCNIYYEPVNGFDPEDLPSEEEAQTPVKIYLSFNEEYGVYVPIRATYKISGFKAVLKMSEFEITGPKIQ